MCDVMVGGGVVSHARDPISLEVHIQIEAGDPISDTPCKLRG